MKKLIFIPAVLAALVTLASCEEDYTNEVVNGDLDYPDSEQSVSLPRCGDGTELYPCGPYAVEVHSVLPNDKIAVTGYHDIEENILTPGENVFTSQQLRVYLLQQGYRYMVLSILAAWCPHCQNETNALSQIIDDYKNKVFFLGVIVTTTTSDIDSSPIVAYSFARQRHLDDKDNYYMSWDPDHRYYFDYLKGGFPTNYVIDLETMEIMREFAAVETTSDWRSILDPLH